MSSDLAYWRDIPALWKAELQAHHMRGEQPTARYIAYVWWVWYGQDGALDRVGCVLGDLAPVGQNYWHKVGYYLLHPEMFDGDYDLWEKC